MPAEVTYLISDPAAVSPFSPPAPMPPVTGSPLTCSQEFFDQAHFLRVLDRAYPLDYVFGLQQKKDGGYELFQAAAKTAERVSIAIGRLECCVFLLYASGGVKSTGEVELYRESAAVGAIDIKAGTVLQSELGGCKFATTEDASFGALDLGPVTVGVEAIDYGWQYNLPGQVITAGGEVIPGSINTIVKLVTDPVELEPNMRVRQIAPTTGGQFACLDLIGEDLELPRLSGEGDDEYRQRIRDTPDTVSPNAICRGIDKLVVPLGATCCLREVGTSLFPGFFYDAGSSTDAPQDPKHNFAYDFDFDIRPEDRFKVYLDVCEFRGFFLVGLPKIIKDDFGIYYDGSNSDLVLRANPYDLSGSVTPSGNGAYDGFTLLDATFYQAVYNTLVEKHAGGVGFDIYIEELGCF